MQYIHTTLRHISHSLRERRCIFLSPNPNKPQEAPREQQGVPQKYETTWNRVEKDVNDIHEDVQRLLGHMKTIGGGGKGADVQAMSDRWTTMHQEKSAALKDSFHKYDETERAQQKAARKIQEIENGLGVIEASIYDESFKEMIRKLQDIESRVLAQKTVPDYVTYQDKINEGWRQQIQEGTLTAKTAGVVFNGKVETVYFLDLPNFVHVQSPSRGQLTRYWGEVRTYFRESELTPGKTVDLYSEDKKKVVTATVEEAPNTPDGRKAVHLVLPEDCEDLLSGPTGPVPSFDDVPSEPGATPPPHPSIDIEWPDLSGPPKPPFTLPGENFDALDRQEAENEYNRIRANVFAQLQSAQSLLGLGSNQYEASLDGANTALKQLSPEDKAKLLNELQATEWFKDTRPDQSGANVVWGLHVEDGEVRAFSENVPEERRAEEAPREDLSKKALEEFDRDTEILLKDIESRVRMGWDENVPEMKIALEALKNRFVEHDKLYREHHNILIDRGHALERKFNAIPDLLHHLGFDHGVKFEFYLVPVAEEVPEPTVKPRDPLAAPAPRPSESAETLKWNKQKLDDALTDLWNRLDGGYRDGLEEELNNTILEQYELDNEKTVAWVNAHAGDTGHSEDDSFSYNLNREGIQFTLKRISEEDDSSPFDNPPGRREPLPDDPDRRSEDRETLTVADFKQQFDDLFEEMHLKLAMQPDGVDAAKDVVNSKINPLVTRALNGGLAAAVNEREGKFSRVKLEARDGTEYRFQRDDNLFSLVEVNEGMNEDQKRLFAEIEKIFRENSPDEAIKKLWDLLKKYFEEHGLLTPPPTLPRPPVDGSAAPPANPDVQPQPRFEPREAKRPELPNVPNENTEKIRQLQQEIEGLRRELREGEARWNVLRDKKPLEFTPQDADEMEQWIIRKRAILDAIAAKEKEIARLSAGQEVREMSEEDKRLVAEFERRKGEYDAKIKEIDARITNNTATETDRIIRQDYIDLRNGVQRSIDAIKAKYTVARPSETGASRPAESTFKPEETPFTQEKIQDLVDKYLLPKYKQKVKEKAGTILVLESMPVTIIGGKVDIVFKFRSGDDASLAKNGLQKGIEEKNIGVGWSVESSENTITIRGLTQEMLVKLAKAEANLDVKFTAAPRAMEWPPSLAPDALQNFMNVNYGGALKGEVEAKVSEGGHVSLSFKAKGEFKAGLSRDFLSNVVQKANCTIEVTADSTIKIDGPDLAMKALFSDVNREIITACLTKTSRDLALWVLNKGDDFILQIHDENPKLFAAIVSILLREVNPNLATALNMSGGPGNSFKRLGVDTPL